jgi:hyperosmotically inducible periplasmic protein
MNTHRTSRAFGALLLSAACSVVTLSATAQQTPADNTKVNKADRAKGAVTADQQKENAADRELAKKIRQAVVGDKSLSTYAHNVKIVAQNGQVTVKGPVRSEQEKTTIAAKATEIAGAGKVTNEMTVAPADAPKKPKG